MSGHGTGIAPEISDRSSTPSTPRQGYRRAPTRLGLSTVYGHRQEDSGGFVYCDSAVGKGHDLPHFPALHSEAERGGRRAHPPETTAPSKKKMPARRRHLLWSLAGRRMVRSDATDLTGHGTTILLVEDEEGLARCLNAACSSRAASVIGPATRRGAQESGQARAGGRSRVSPRG